MPSCSQHRFCVLRVLPALLLPTIFPLLPPHQCKAIFSWRFRLICNSHCKFLSISSYSQKVWIREWFALQEASCFPGFSGLLLFVEWGWYYTLQTKWLLTHPCPGTGIRPSSAKHCLVDGPSRNIGSKSKESMSDPEIFLDQSVRG